jgi:hypothetical protein
LIHFIGYADITEYANNSVPSTLITYSYKQQRFIESIAIERPGGQYVRTLYRLLVCVRPTNACTLKASQWVAIVSMGDSNKNKLLVELVGPNGQGEYRYQYRFLSANGAVSDVHAAFPFDDTFVNFFWADFDQVNQKLYILSGDENSFYTLRYAQAPYLVVPHQRAVYRLTAVAVIRVKLFVVDLKTKTLTNVMVDNSRFTLTNVHVVRTIARVTDTNNTPHLIRAWFRLIISTPLVALWLCLLACSPATSSTPLGLSSRSTLAPAR